MDKSIGTWKLNVQKSKYTPAPFPLKSQTMIRSASDGGVKVKTTGVQADGKPNNSSYTITYDGKDCPATGATFDTIALNQVDANNFTFTARQASGKLHITGRTVISNDGKVMTMTGSGTDADGKAVSATLVYDK